MGAVRHGRRDSVSAPSIGRKVILSGCIKASQLLLGVGSSLLLARWLGATGYGAYSFAFVLASLLAIPAQLGWPSLLTREVARLGHADLAQLAGVLRTSFRWVSWSSLAMVVACLGIGYAISGKLAGQDASTLYLASALVPLTAWIGIRAAALRGLEHVLQAQLLDGILRPAIFLLILAFLIGRHLSPATAMFAQVLATFVAFTVGTVVLVRVLPSGIRRIPPDAHRAAEWRRSMYPFMLVSAAQVLTTQADLFALGLVSDASEVGIYKVATMVGTQVGFAVWLVNAVFAPRIVKLHRHGQHEELQALLSKGVRFALIVAAPAAACIVAFGRPALEIALGEQFGPAYWPMVIIALGQLIGVSAGPVGMLLGMTGHERGVARILTLCGLSSVVLTLVLASKYGPFGAAIAASASLILSRVMLRALATRVLRRS